MMRPEEGSRSDLEAVGSEGGADDRVIGAVLIEAIRKRAVELEMDAAQTATALGLSYTYYSALTGGRRPISQIRREQFDKIAKFLGVAYAQVLVWAEVVTVEDFVHKETLEDDLDLAYAKMVHDPVWGGIIPDRKTWMETPIRSRLALVMLYEKIASKRLIEKVRVGKILDRIPAEFE